MKIKLRDFVVFQNRIGVEESARFAAHHSVVNAVRKSSRGKNAGINISDIKILTVYHLKIVLGTDCAGLVYHNR